MSRNLSNALLGELYNQQSGDPLIMLVTLTHTSFSTIYLCDNIEDIVSRGNTYTAFPMMISLPSENGATTQKAQITFDNVSLDLIDEIRTVTSPIEVALEVVLASDPDTVEISFEELKIQNVSYDSVSIRADLYLDDFLNTELSSERYTPTLFPGLFT